MSEERKRTPAEVWLALERMTEEVELERIDALTDEELDREVLASGIDPRALDAAIAATVLVQFEELPRGIPVRGPRRSRRPGAPFAPRTSARRLLAWLVAGAALALGFVVLARHRDSVARLAPATGAAEVAAPHVTASPAALPAPKAN